MVRRFFAFALSLTLVLGLGAFGRGLAQDEKKDETKADAPKTDAAKPEAKPDDTKGEPAKAKTETPSAASEELPPIPPEVQAKLDAARKAVAEAIVAAQEAGLVETTADVPPILDVLVTGRALDRRGLTASPKKGISPEAFGAWFTGHAKMEGINPQNDVRIFQPSRGLKELFDQRDAVMKPLIEAARAAKTAPAAAKAEEPKKEEPKPAEEPKKEEPKKEEPKPEQPKPEEPKKEEAKKEEPKPEQPKAEEPKKEEPKKEEPKPAEEPKKEEAKPAEEPKKEEPKAEEPKKEEEKPKEEPKAEEPKAEAPKAEEPK
jgi:hypothetical protein